MQRDGKLWTQLCRSIDVSSRRGFHVEVDIEHDVALFRLDGIVYGVSNICTHKREAEICNGAIENGTVTCPLHGWMYDIRTGMKTGEAEAPEDAVITLGRGLQSYPILEHADYVWTILD